MQAGLRQTPLQMVWREVGVVARLRGVIGTISPVHGLCRDLVVSSGCVGLRLCSIKLLDAQLYCVLLDLEITQTSVVLVGSLVEGTNLNLDDGKLKFQVLDGGVLVERERHSYELLRKPPAAVKQSIVLFRRVCGDTLCKGGCRRERGFGCSAIYAGSSQACDSVPQQRCEFCIDGEE